MDDDSPDDRPARNASTWDWWDLTAAVILSLATVASAWSGYQAARWSGEKVKANREAVVALVAANRQMDDANGLRTIDVTVFSQWLEAVADGDTELSSFLQARFRPDFLPAFNAWLSTAAAGAVPTGSPFDLDEYRLPAAAEAGRLLDAYQAEADRADEANQVGDNYVLIAVLYASVLFFAGIASKLKSPKASHLTIGLGATMFVLATIVMLTLPANFAF